MRVNGLHRVFHWRRPKENPDTLPMVGVSALRCSMALRHSAANCSGLLAVRPAVEEEKADEERDGKASRKEIEIHCGLVAAFNFLDDDGANDKGDGDASR